MYTSTQVLKLIFNTPGVVNVHTRNDIEVQPGVFSNIYINMKTVFYYPDIRVKFANLLSSIVSGTQVICGIESGGSYYASAVTDIIKVPLIYYRKKRKWVF